MDFPKEQRGRFTPVGKPQLKTRLFTRGGAIRPTIPQVMKYNQLSNIEKIACVREMNFCRTERHDAAVYLNALRTDNRAIIEEYESFGERPYQFFLNKRTYYAGLRFGFTDKRYDEYGWLKNADFTGQERIEFFPTGSSVSFNHLTIGKGSNGKWSYGASYSTGAAGCGYGLGIWGKVFDTRKECLKAALQEIMNGHRRYEKDLKDDTCGNFNARLSREIVRQVKDLFDELTGRKAVQLSFF